MLSLSHRRTDSRVLENGSAIANLVSQELMGQANHSTGDLLSLSTRKHLVHHQPVSRSIFLL